MTPAEFRTSLWQRGIELVARNNQRLYVWPGRAYREGMSEAERAFLKEHSAELKALARSAPLPEVPMAWPNATGTATSPPSPLPSAAHCSHCGDRPCVGSDDRWYRVLHWNDPAEVARRTVEHTRVMLSTMGRAT